MVKLMEVDVLIISSHPGVRWMKQTDVARFILNNSEATHNELAVQILNCRESEKKEPPKVVMPETEAVNKLQAQLGQLKKEYNAVLFIGVVALFGLVALAIALVNEVSKHHNVLQ